MWASVRYAVGTVAVAMMGSWASGGVVADFQKDFKAGTPKAGWSYLWNASGPVGNAANYVPLVPGSQFAPTYEPTSSVPPHAGAGSYLEVSKMTIRPGLGSMQAADGIEHCAIVGYTISAADIAENGGEAWMDSYRFSVPFSTEANGINTAIYVNDQLLIAMPLPPGLDYDSASSYGAYPVPLGNLKAGDTVYVAIGAGGFDTEDALNISFTVSLVPEPGTLGVLGLAGIGLLGRRRRIA